MTSQNDPFLPPADERSGPPAAPDGQPGYAPPPGLASPPAYTAPPTYGAAPSYAAPQPPTEPHAPVQQYGPPPVHDQGQPYGAPAPYAYPPSAYGAHRRPDEKNWMGIVALIGALVGIFMGLFTTIPAIVFGHLGRSAARKGEASNGSLALGGLVTAYIVSALWILGFIAYWVFVVFMISSGY